MTPFRATMPHRRAFIALCLAAAAPAAPAQPAGWPARTLRLIVAYPPGGTTDVVARTLAERLAAQLGQAVVVENRGGAAGAVGMEAVSKAAPDGHTIGIAAVSPLTLNPHLGHLPFDALRDIAPVASVMYAPVYLLATPAFKGRTFDDILTLAREKPGALRVATSGIASVGHLMVEQLKAKSRIELTHVPYKGGAQVATDAAGGQFELFTTNPNPAVNALIRAGTLRVLAVGAPQRLPGLPQVPTLAEAGHAEANLTSTFGIFAPGRTPDAVLARLAAEVVRAMATPDMAERLKSLDNVPWVMNGATFGAFIRSESAQNAKIIASGGIKAE